ncbi:low-density lipoprotein receptor-related protein 3 [Puma concolor]|uniref:Low-density lipoprotein receptor-related protein 3 n=1 Tax=Puma concolor TaxID=9696 RepID=A0A6P6H496_PUMCO|nr:low-density lipoprotein receptor-related protein 3 [Puma concolor]
MTIRLGNQLDKSGLEFASAVNIVLTGRLSSAVPALAACSGKLEQHTERRGVIYSPAWPLNYPPGTNCSWYIQGDRGDMITISFRNFDVEESHQCSLDWLMLGPAAPPRQEAFRLCGSAIPPAFISARDHVWIFFHSDASSSGQAQGFRLSYIRGKLGQASCQADEFRCDNGKCLPGPWQCNTVDECGDGSDEGNCSAPASEPPGSLCPGGTFPCSGARSTRCLPAERRCDGTQDCGDGSDEAGCPDLACGRRLGSFYGSFASPDLFGAARGPSDLHCTWLVDTQDPRRVLLQRPSRRRLGRLWNRLFHRPRAPRGQIPLLTAARTSQTVLGDGLLQPAPGTTPDPPAPLTDTGSPVGAGDGPPSVPGHASEAGSAVPPPSGLRDPECRLGDKDRKACRDSLVDSLAPAEAPREPCSAQDPHPLAPTASSTLGPHPPEPLGVCRSPPPPCSPTLEASDDEALLVC